MVAFEPYSAEARYESHVTKLFDRLDVAYKDIELKEYKDCLLAARQLVLSLVALRRHAHESATGSAVEHYSATFAKNAATSRAAHARPDADADAEPTDIDTLLAADSAGNSDDDDADGRSADGNGSERGLETGDSGRR
jgi:hypothetical protein